MLEIDHAMQSLSKVMKQTGEITLNCNCFRDFQQGLVLLCRVSQGDAVCLSMALSIA